MSDEKEETTEVSQRPFGVLAEYNGPDELIAAAKKVRDEGYTRWDCYSPFPVHGIDPAMGIKKTKLPYIVVCAGLTGCATALLLQWWTNGYDYPWIVSGKPLFGVPANIPITFELTVLFSAITTFVSMLLLNGLPKPSSPLDMVKRFDRVTDDRFFIVIESDDPKYDDADTRELLQKTDPNAVEAVPADNRSDTMPKELIYGVLIIAALALVPFGMFASMRESQSGNLAFHPVPNMDFQLKYKPQKESDFFADKRTSRGVVEGTVAIGELRHDDHFFKGKVGDAWALTLPERVKADEATMARGKQRFGIYCAPCHGDTGDGNGMVHERAFALKEGTWVKPTNINDPKIAVKPVGELFHTIGNGIRNMPGYARQIDVEDRWAILLYVRALQHSQRQYVAQNAVMPETPPTGVPADAVEQGSSAGSEAAGSDSAGSEAAGSEAAAAAQPAADAPAGDKPAAEPAAEPKAAAPAPKADAPAAQPKPETPAAPQAAEPKPAQPAAPAEEK